MRPRASLFCSAALLALALQQQQCPQATRPARPAAPPLVITTDALPHATLGHSYTVRLEATGGAPPHTWRVADGALPPGLALQPDGTISGVPTAAGNYAFAAEVRDSATNAAFASRAFGDLDRHAAKQNLRTSAARFFAR